MGEMVRLLRVINKDLGRLNSEFERIAREQFAGKWEFSVVAETHATQLVSNRRLDFSVLHFDVKVLVVVTWKGWCNKHLVS